MPVLIPAPSIIEAAGEPPKRIEEYVGRVNTGEDRLSIARMASPAGWAEPGQTPEFDEFTVVVEGTLQVEHADGVTEVNAGQAIWTRAGEWVRYGTPAGPCRYFAVCLPAFSPATVHRDA